MAQPRISFFLKSILGLIGADIEIKKQKKIDFFQNYKKMIHKKGKNTAKTLKWMCLKPVEGWLMKIWLRNWSSKIFPSPFNTMFIRQLQIKGVVHLVYLYKRVYYMIGNYLLDKINFERNYISCLKIKDGFVWLKLIWNHWEERKNKKAFTKIWKKN